MDWSVEFPGLNASTYLNSCAHGLLPARTRRALEAHLDKWTTSPDWGAWMDSVEDARKAFARLIHARVEDTAVMSNATQGIASVMNALGPARARREIVTTDLDFPASPFVAERMKARGFDHHHIRSSPTPLRVEAWRKHLHPETALACIPAVGSFTGYRFDVPTFARAAHEAGVPLLVDAFQAAGNVDIDVRKGDVDFLVSGVYKWLMAPAGLAFLYARREHHHMMPTTSGWQGGTASYSFDPLQTLAPDARRFQSGGPSVIGCVGAVRSLGLIEEVGISSIERRNRELVERVIAKAEERKLEILTPKLSEERASIVTFRVPHVERALEALARENVIVNPRLGGIRVSPHFYNRDADVDRLFAVLDTVA